MYQRLGQLRKSAFKKIIRILIQAGDKIEVLITILSLMKFVSCLCPCGEDRSPTVVYSAASAARNLKQILCGNSEVADEMKATSFSTKYWIVCLKIFFKYF